MEDRKRPSSIGRGEYQIRQSQEFLENIRRSNAKKLRRKN
jgi:hypothetical protein